MAYLNVTAVGSRQSEPQGANLLISVTNQEGQPVHNLSQESFSIWAVGIEADKSELLILTPLEIVTLNSSSFTAPGEPFYALQVGGNNAFNILVGGTGGLLAITVTQSLGIGLTVKGYTTVSIPGL